MRILYLCHRIPYPPNKGDKIRAFHQLQAMAARHEVDVFTLADDAGDLVYRDALAGYCHQLTVAPVHPKIAGLRALRYLPTQRPLTVPYFSSAELQAEVERALLRLSYDRIFIYSSAMAQYVESAGAIPMVVDLVDVDSDKWTQYAKFTRFPFSSIYRREGRYLREYERQVCAKSCCVVVSTGREANLVREIAPDTHLEVVPNGVDTAYFDPAVVPPDRTMPTAVFTGDMSYYPNQDAVIYFARKVLPLVRKFVPKIRFLIVGRKPNRAVMHLQKIDGVEITGFVPDVRTYLAKAHVAVAPFTIAAGIQNKILEAMAYGLPVVATTRTAQGLSSSVADLVDTGDTAEELASKTVKLLCDSEFAQGKGVEGRRRVAGEYKWEDSLERLLQLLENPIDAACPLPANPGPSRAVSGYR
jgi:sugar transferase (PEP-CTERM/EpsH1 system associated)